LSIQVDKFAAAYTDPVSGLQVGWVLFGYFPSIDQVEILRHVCLKDGEQSVEIMRQLLAATQWLVSEYKLKQLQAWNPTEQFLAAARAIDADAQVVYREDSINSIAYYGQETEFQWMENEAYTWCGVNI